MGNDNDGGEPTGTSTGWNEQKPDAMLTMSEEWTISDAQNCRVVIARFPERRYLLRTQKQESRDSIWRERGRGKTYTLHNAHFQKQTLP